MSLEMYMAKYFSRPKKVGSCRKNEDLVLTVHCTKLLLHTTCSRIPSFANYFQALPSLLIRFAFFRPLLRVWAGSTLLLYCSTLEESVGLFERIVSSGEHRYDHGFTLLFLRHTVHSERTV
jgi:hypothetical protein